MQIGFVCGALTASLVNLPDIVRLKPRMALSALLAAAANVLLLVQHGPIGAVAARLVTDWPWPMVSELADQRFVGTALSVQLGLRFALTVVAIWLMPRLADFLGSWRWAFLILVPGPSIGASAMLLTPGSARLAKGMH